MNHAPRSGMSGELGALHGLALADGGLICLHVPLPVAVEGDFWICTCERAANEDYFFGPTVAA